jgi:dihydroorotate dehydrogenase/Pyruvate/2-oxoacid:ferredoxin oxidoreductase delta subunit
MADISIELLGLSFRNPILTAAGPTSRDGMTLLNAAAGGVGGLVAKTVSVKPAEVPRPNMAALKEGRVGSRTGILNAELWSELPLETWLEREYPIAPKLEKAGVKAIEFSTHYVGGHVEIAKALRDAVEIPIIAKLSPKVDVAEVARALEPHVDAIAAINTFGPCLRIDIESGRPMLGSGDGYGWMSGSALKPIAIRCVADIAQTVKLPIIGVGGVMSGADVIEFIMAGASAVQVCTAAILEGHTIYGKIAGQVEEWLDSHGYSSLRDIQGKALPHLRQGVSLDPPPIVDLDKCTRCGLCEKSCVYGAITVKKSEDLFAIDANECEACGMCISVCPYFALSY